MFIAINDTAAVFYVCLYIALTFASIFLLKEYIEEREVDAFWNGYELCRKNNNK